MTLRQLRLMQALSQEEAAEAIGASRVSISLWESGKKTPRLFYIRKMADAYKCSIEDIFSALGLTGCEAEK